MVMIIRAERAADLEAVQHVNQRAFEGPVEAAIVDSLRDGMPWRCRWWRILTGKWSVTSCFHP